MGSDFEKLYAQTDSIGVKFHHAPKRFMGFKHTEQVSKIQKGVFSFGLIAKTSFKYYSLKMDKLK